MKTLIIWQTIPDTTECYLIENNPRVHQLAVQCAGVYINCNDEDEHPIHELYEKLPYLPKTSSNEVIRDDIDTVVICGFIT